MKNQLIIILSYFCISSTIASHERKESTIATESYMSYQDSANFAVFDDLGFDFDDFPDNSTPDLESYLDATCIEAELEEIQTKDLNDFGSLPDQAETIHDQSEFAMDLHGLPSAIVNGCVNALNGEYQESTIDFSLPGCIPLNFQRYYCGSGCRKHSFLSGWQLNHGAKLFLSKKFTKHSHTIALLQGSDRHGIKYKKELSRGYYACPPHLFNKSITNCGFGEISAKNNFKNDYLQKIHSTFRLQTADKTQYHFIKTWHDPERKEGAKTFKLERVELPGGNSYTYRYAQTFGMPISILFFNREGIETAGMRLKINLSQKEFQANPEITYLTSSEEQIKYRFKLYGDRSKKRAILSEVIPPHAPKIKYSYELVRQHYKQKRLVRRELPDERVLEITYDSNGKVQELLSPTGDGGKLLATHTFKYLKKGIKRFTHIKNALGGVKVYYWNTNSKRIDQIGTWDDKKNRIFKERYKWGDEKNDKSHLTARILEEGSGELVSYQHYEYDLYGNITCLSLYGHLTGAFNTPLYINESLDSPAERACDVHKTHYTYDSNNRRISEDDGRCVTRYYYVNATNQLSSDAIFYDGRTQIRHFYRYDASGAICQEITDDGSIENAPEDLTHVTMRYIKEIKNTLTGLPESVEEYALDLSSGQHKLMRSTTNQYDRHGWLIAQSLYDCNNKLSHTLEWKHDSHGNVIYEKDPLGNVTESKYDDNDNLIYEQKPNQATRILSYDRMNRLIHEELKGHHENQRKSYRYDAMGNCISSTDIYGNITCHKYDSNSRLIETKYAASDNAHAQPTIKYCRNGVGLATSITDANGNATLIEYNLRGKPISTVYSDGFVEKNTYTLWGELAESVARDGSRIRITYDSQGREIKKEWFDCNGNQLKTTTKRYNAFHLIGETDGKGNETSYIYDRAGRLISEKIGGKLTCYGYDTLGRKNSTTKIRGNNTSIAYVEIYDALDRVVESYHLSHENEISNRTLIEYDSRGNEIKRQEWNQAGKSITTSRYDLFGRVICVTDPLGNSTYTTYHLSETPCMEVTDPLGIKTTLTYDSFGHPILEQRFDPMGKLVEETAYAYDLNGNKILRRVKTGTQPVETQWYYDSLNQLIETVEAAGTLEQKRVQRRYDVAGRLASIVKNDGNTLLYLYDSFGRRTSLKSADGTLFYTFKYDQNDNLIGARDKIHGQSVKRNYDEYDQLTSDTLPYGHALHYDYDLIGNLKRVTLPDQTKISYLRNGDKLIEVKRTGQLCYSHQYMSYDPSANPTQVVLAQGAGMLRVSYDLLNRPTNIQTSQWQEVLEYQVHQLKQRGLRDAFGETNSFYSYDARNQILSENGTAAHHFEYDWQGNAVSYDGKTRKFNACNALLKDQSHRYIYDSNGNRISDGINTYAYDALDRLIEVVTPTGTYRYIYDALGRRIARLHENEKTYFLWQKDQEIGIISPEGVIDELQVLNPSNHAVALELKGVLYVPLHDIFGHVRALLDSEGACVATYRYSAFGEEQMLGDLLSPWRYAGKRIDPETGFIYFGERYYDPATLTWITPDPMEDADGPNLYAYVHNNPLFYVDPDGCFSLDWMKSGWARAGLLLADAALIASVVGSGLAGVAEGFLAGCSGGISGTAIDLAFDAVALCGEGGVAAACAGAEATAISYNSCKAVGQIAGALFSCTPAGKGAQVGMGLANVGIKGAKSAKTVFKATKSIGGANSTGNYVRSAVKTSKIMNKDGLVHIKPKILEGNKDYGLKHILKRHDHNTNAKKVSRFLQGMGKKEIGDLVNEACNGAKNWRVAKNEFLTITVDMGRTIGTKKDCGSPTSLLKIIFKEDTLRTAYPF